MANPSETALDIYDLESTTEHTREFDEKSEVSSTQTTTRTSVFDRLYADSRSRKKTETKPEDQKPRTEPKVTTKPLKQAHSKHPRKVSNEPSATTRNEPAAHGEPDLVNEVHETSATTSNVYERLYRTSTQARKASQKPTNEATANLVTSHSESNRSNLGPRKTREPKISKKSSPLNLTESNHEEREAEDRTGSEANPEAGKSESAETETKEEEPSFSFFFGRPLTAVKSARPILRVPPSAKIKKHKKSRSWRIQRLPVILIERTSLARGALPILPRPLAWICLVLNILIPGSGTILSGFLGLCCGAPRFSVRVTSEHRFLGLVINFTIGVFQIVTILFCLVGWCWSLGWGILLIQNSEKYSRWKKNAKNGANNELHIHDEDDYISTMDSYNNIRF